MIKDFEKELHSKRFAEDNSIMDENAKILIKKNGPLSPNAQPEQVKKDGKKLPDASADKEA